MLSAPFTISTNVNEGHFGTVHRLSSKYSTFCKEAEVIPVVLVRYHFGREPNESPYNFIHGFMDMGTFVEFIPMKEYQERIELAKSHGDEYTGLDNGMIAVTDPAFGNSVMYRDGHLNSMMGVIAECIEIQRKFETLISLDIFRLPITL